MDTFTITLLGGCGTALTGAIAILWRSLEKQRDDNSSKDKTIIEQFYSAKTQNESIQALLVIMKDQLGAIPNALESLETKILQAIRKKGK